MESPQIACTFQVENSNYAIIIPNIGVPQNIPNYPDFFIQLVLSRELFITITSGTTKSAAPDQTAPIGAV